MHPESQPKMSQRGRVLRRPDVTVSIIELTRSETTSGRISARSGISLRKTSQPEKTVRRTWPSPEPTSRGSIIAW